jgi:toxin ParE1/3/4
MSRLYWSQDAETDLDALTAYISGDDVLAAIRMRDEIERRLEVLADHPRAGRVGRVRVLGNWSSQARHTGVYRLQGDDVIILRVLHGARRWPPGGETRN